MTKSTAYLFFLCFCFSMLTAEARGQFINLQLTIEPELVVEVQQDLDFGTLISNSGRNEINLGDVNMGVFSIVAYYTQNILVSIDTPDYLSNTYPNSTDVIPISLTSSYANLGQDNPGQAKPLLDNSQYLSIHEDENAEQADFEIWQDFYVYVYGFMEVGNVDNGTYTGEVVLNVQYD